MDILGDEYKIWRFVFPQNGQLLSWFARKIMSCEVITIQNYCYALVSCHIFVD